MLFFIKAYCGAGAVTEALAIDDNFEAFRELIEKANLMRELKISEVESGVLRALRLAFGKA